MTYKYFLTVVNKLRKTIYRLAGVRIYGYRCVRLPLAPQQTTIDYTVLKNNWTNTINFENFMSLYIEIDISTRIHWNNTGCISVFAEYFFNLRFMLRFIRYLLACYNLN